MAPTELPFELRALECIIEDACLKLEQDFEILHEEVVAAQLAIAAVTGTPELTRMHRAKRVMLRYITRAQELNDCLEELIANEDDLIEMHLSAKFHFQANYRSLLQRGGGGGAAIKRSFAEWRRECGGGDAGTQELEIMLQVYQETIEYLLVEARNLEEGVKDTEELVSLQLDTQRNKILGVEMVITVASAFFAFGAFVVGIFGMNFQWEAGILDEQPRSRLLSGRDYFWLTIVATVTTVSHRSLLIDHILPDIQLYMHTAAIIILCFFALR